MPSAVILAQKQATVKELAEKLDASRAKAAEKVLAANRALEEKYNH